MDLVSRLKLFMESKGIASTQFADMCEIPRPTVSQILNGRNKKISDEIIRKIHSAFPSLSVSWLMFGEGEMESISNIRFSAPQEWQKSSIDDREQTGNQKDSFIGEPFSHGADMRPENLNATIETSPAHFSASVPQPTVQKVEDGINAELQASVNNESNNTGPSVISRQMGNESEEKKNGKRIVNIMVFYDDNTFETFVLDGSKR